ncbi:MAG: nucleotide exchange factor GrpE [Proteobacteria bacterium]|nr:nucleotide exchange factor GrpE [Pseudomonadota bacterium]
MSDPTPPDAPEAAAAMAEPTPEQRLVAANEKADENYNQYVRVLAEFDNYRKRIARDLEQAQRFAVERFAQDLLPAMDGFELALANAAGADVNSLLEGQQATRRLLAKAFEKAGIAELVPAAGVPFNPEQHEAMVAQPTADVPPDAVLQTIQKGYALNGRVLRPARVIVARALDA